MSIEQIAAIATIALAAFTLVVKPMCRLVCAAWRWCREHYRRPSWADAWVKTRLHHRRQKAARRKAEETAALREAEEIAPGLLTKLQRSLEESPDQRRFRVLQGGGLPIFDVSAGPTIDYVHDGDGDLKGWVARHAEGLFRQVPGMSSPPVYEMSEELVRYLNGRGAPADGRCI